LQFNSPVSQDVVFLGRTTGESMFDLNISPENAMRQAGMTASSYAYDGLEFVEKQFGKEWVESHKAEALAFAGQFAQAAALDFLCTGVAHKLQDDIRSALMEIAEALKGAE
jgi:hypothetical protein